MVCLKSGVGQEIYSLAPHGRVPEIGQRITSRPIYWPDGLRPNKTSVAHYSALVSLSAAAATKSSISFHDERASERCLHSSLTDGKLTSCASYKPFISNGRHIFVESVVIFRTKDPKLEIDLSIYVYDSICL